MSFFDNIKVFNKKSSIRKEVDDIIGKLPSSDIIAKDILNKLEQKNFYDKEVLSLNNYQKPTIEYIEKENPKHVKIIEYLSNLEVNNMKPLDALIELSKIKEELEHE